MNASERVDEQRECRLCAHWAANAFPGPGNGFCGVHGRSDADAELCDGYRHRLEPEPVEALLCNLAADLAKATTEPTATTGTTGTFAPEEDAP